MPKVRKQKDKTSIINCPGGNHNRNKNKKKLVILYWKKVQFDLPVPNIQLIYKLCIFVYPNRTCRIFLNRLTINYRSITKTKIGPWICFIYTCNWKNCFLPVISTAQHMCKNLPGRPGGTTIKNYSLSHLASQKYFIFKENGRTK